MAIKTYDVKSRVSFGKANDDGKILVKAKDYEPGSTIDLEDEDAKPLLEAGAIAAETKAKK